MVYIDVRQILLFSVFLSFFFVLNAYALLRLAHLFSYSPTTSYYVFIFLATISFIVVTILANSIHNLVTTLLYRIVALWLGVLALLTPLLLIEHVLSLFVSYSSYSAGIWVLSITTVLSVYSLYNAQQFKHKDVVIESDKVSRPYDIVHLSDLHLGPINQGRYMKKLISEVALLDADVVCITGDLIDMPALLAKDLLTPFNQLTVPLYASSGNHDRYVGIPVLIDLLAQTNIKFIDGVTARFQELEIVGIADQDEKTAVSKNLPSISSDAFTILSYHRPIEFTHAAESGVDLMLSGHTHAGQLLSFRPFIKLEFSYVWGVFTHLQSTLHVTSGTGTWGPPMRFGSSNEITRVRVVPKDD